MRCDQFEHQLTAFVLDPAQAGRAAEARGHLAGCAACRLLHERERHLVRQLRLAVRPAPPATHRQVAELLGSAPARRPRPARRLSRPGRVLVLATVLGVAVCVLAVFAAGLLPARKAGVPTAAPATTAAPPLVPEAVASAAWAAFAAPALPLEGDTGTAGQPDLGRLGLQLLASGRVRLGGVRAAATEYRGSGGRLVVLRWRTTGTTPGTPAPAAGRDTRWGRAGLVCWPERGRTACVAGAPAELAGRAAALVKGAP
jgi:hypothetical protein